MSETLYIVILTDHEAISMRTYGPYNSEFMARAKLIQSYVEQQLFIYSDQLTYDDAVNNGKLPAQKQHISDSDIWNDFYETQITPILTEHFIEKAEWKLQRFITDVIDRRRTFTLDTPKYEIYSKIGNYSVGVYKIVS